MSYASRWIGVVVACLVAFLPFLVSCSGGGGTETPGTPNIAVLVDGAAPPAGGVDFGSVWCDHETADHTLTIKNTGTATLSVSGYTITANTSEAGEWSVVGTFPTSMPADSQAGVTLHFAPTWIPTSHGYGNRQETVTITSDDPDEGSFAFDVYGTAASSG